MAIGTSAGAQQLTPRPPPPAHRRRPRTPRPATARHGSVGGDGVAQPGRDPQPGDRGHQRLSLIGIGHRFQGEHVRARLGQHLQPRPVPGRQFPHAAPVPTRYSDPSASAAPYGPAEPATHRARPSPASWSRGPRKVHAAPHQPGRLTAAKLSPREPLEGCLITRRRRDLGPARKNGRCASRISSGASINSRADHSESDRSFPRTSSSVTRPPSATSTASPGTNTLTTPL
jgi:hypothetical protein